MTTHHTAHSHVDRVSTRVIEQRTHWSPIPQQTSLHIHGFSHTALHSTVIQGQESNHRCTGAWSSWSQAVGTGRSDGHSATAARRKAAPKAARRGFASRLRGVRRGTLPLASGSRLGLAQVGPGAGRAGCGCGLAGWLAAPPGPRTPLPRRAPSPFPSHLAWQVGPSAPHPNHTAAAGWWGSQLAGPGRARALGHRLSDQTGPAQGPASIPSPHQVQQWCSPAAGLVAGDVPSTQGSAVLVPGGVCQHGQHARTAPQTLIRPSASSWPPRLSL